MPCHHRVVPLGPCLQVLNANPQSCFSALTSILFDSAVIRGRGQAAAGGAGVGVRRAGAQGRRQRGRAVVQLGELDALSHVRPLQGSAHLRRPCRAQLQRAFAAPARGRVAVKARPPPRSAPRCARARRRCAAYRADGNSRERRAATAYPFPAARPQKDIGSRTEQLRKVRDDNSIVRGDIGGEQPAWKWCARAPRTPTPDGAPDRARRGLRRARDACEARRAACVMRARARGGGAGGRGYVAGRAARAGAPHTCESRAPPADWGAHQAMHGAFHARASPASRTRRVALHTHRAFGAGLGAPGPAPRPACACAARARARTTSTRAARRRCCHRRWSCRREPFAAAPSARQCLSAGARPGVGKPRRRGARLNVRQRGARRSDGARAHIVVRYAGVGALLPRRGRARGLRTRAGAARDTGASGVQHLGEVERETKGTRCIHRRQGLREP